MKKISIILVVVAMTIACNANIDIEREKATLMNVDRAFSRLSVEKGMYEAFDSYMADDAVMYRERSHPFMGREAIRPLLPKGNEAGTLKWEPTFADVAASGDLGYTLGNYEYITTDSLGNERIGRGYYISVWKKQAAGEWKWVFDSGIQAPREDKN